MDFLHWISTSAAAADGAPVPAAAPAGTAGTTTSTGTAATPPSLFGSLQQAMPMIAIIFVAFYLLILRPQKRDQQKRDNALNAVAKGDKVVTIGGIHGTVESIDADKGVVTLAVAPKISMKFNKSAISTIESRKGDKQEE